MARPAPPPDPAASMQVVATAGHVDHGKSALLRRLTGMEPDRWAEERRRGLTIDLGYVWTELTGADGRSVTVAFVDVPGHDSFLPNMLCGVGVVDQVLFVVAADDGWSAQSEEHLEIVDLLERRGVAVAVTKAGLVSAERAAEVVDEVSRRLAGSSLHDAPIHVVDSIDGQGIDALRMVLTDVLSVRPPPAASAAVQDLRLWIDRSFTITGAGTVVTGMLASGRLEAGQEVEVAPRGLHGRVRGLQCLERPVRSAGPGTRVAVNLAGIEHTAVGRGDALVSRDAAVPGAERTTSAIDVELRALPHTAVRLRGAWSMHVGTAATNVRVLPLLGEIDPGARGSARLELAEPLPLVVGDRFILRELGRRHTVGGGVVLDPRPADRPRGSERRLAHALVLEHLADVTDPHDRLVGLVDAHAGVRAQAELRAIVGSPALAAVAAGSVPALTVVDDQVIRRDVVDRWIGAVARIADLAGSEHAVDLARLMSAAVEQGCPLALAAPLVGRAVEDGVLRTYGGRYVHPRHERSYLAACARRVDAFVSLLAASPWDPPDPQHAATEVAIASFEIQSLLDDGVLVAVGPLLFVRSAVIDAAERLRAGPGHRGRPFTASEAKRAWATSRRAAVPLLEHLRATGVTTFDGTHHRFVPDATSTTRA